MQPLVGTRVVKFHSIMIEKEDEGGWIELDYTFEY